MQLMSSWQHLPGAQLHVCEYVEPSSLIRGKTMLIVSTDGHYLCCSPLCVGGDSAPTVLSSFSTLAMPLQYARRSAESFSAARVRLPQDLGRCLGSGSSGLSI